MATMSALSSTPQVLFISKAAHGLATSGSMSQFHVPREKVGFVLLGSGNHLLNSEPIKLWPGVGLSLEDGMKQVL